MTELERKAREDHKNTVMEGYDSSINIFDLIEELLKHAKEGKTTVYLRASSEPGPQEGVDGSFEYYPNATLIVGD